MPLQKTVSRGKSWRVAQSLENYGLSAGLQIIYWPIKSGGRRKFLSHLSRVFNKAYDGNVNYIMVGSLKCLSQ